MTITDKTFIKDTFEGIIFSQDLSEMPNNPD